MYRLLAIDIDGTLLNSRDQLSDRTRDAVRAATAAGIRVVLVTGRRYSKALPYVEPLEIDAPVVTASGALIKHPAEDHRTLFAAEFEDEMLRALLGVVDEAGYEPLLYADTFHEGFDYYFRGHARENPELAEYLERNRVHGRVLEDLFEQPPAGVFAGFAMGRREAMLKLAEQLEQALPTLLSLHVLRSPLYAGYMCEMAPAQATKWSGVKHLADEWGIAGEEICAVGDDVNDLPMIAAAGLGVAMGNAQPPVKAVADRIAPPHDEDGLAEVVSWLLEARGR